MKPLAFRLLAAIGLLSALAQAPAQTLTYYYNSLDSNPYDFSGTLTVPGGYPGNVVPFLSFTMSAVVDGQTLTFTASDQTGSSEAIYDTNSSDPLEVLGQPTYSILDTLIPDQGEQGLVLNPAIPSGLGSPEIDDLPSFPVIVDASDSGEWLQTPPSGSTPVPEGSPVTMSLLAISALCCGLALYRNSLVPRNP